MSSLFGSGMPKRATPSAPQPNDPTMQAARDATAQSAASSFGRAATIATGGGQGATGAAPVAKKTLLGGAGG